MNRQLPTFIGTAGWTVPRESAPRFGAEGTHLQRYAAALNGVEINSSFYRPHRPATYARWAASTPDGFRFAVKIPREITHKKRFVNVADDLAKFLAEVRHLGEKLGPLLVQLPPGFDYDADLARAFFDQLRARFGGQVAFEPRHAAWFGEAPARLLWEYEISRVAADPPPVSGADQPGAWPGLEYYRLHGSPRIYYSPYPPEFLTGLAARLRAGGPAERWAVFDNTALGYAAGDALRVRDLVGG